MFTRRESTSKCSRDCKDPAYGIVKHLRIWIKRIDEMLMIFLYSPSPYDVKNSLHRNGLPKKPKGPVMSDGASLLSRCSYAAQSLATRRT